MTKMFFTRSALTVIGHFCYIPLLKRQVYSSATSSNCIFADRDMLFVQASGFGGSNIDATAWEDKKCKGESRFPAQVSD